MERKSLLEDSHSKHAEKIMSLHLQYWSQAIKKIKIKFWRNCKKVVAGHRSSHSGGLQINVGNLGFTSTWKSLENSSSFGICSWAPTTNMPLQGAYTISALTAYSVQSYGVHWINPPLEKPAFSPNLCDASISLKPLIRPACKQLHLACFNGFLLVIYLWTVLVKLQLLSLEFAHPRVTWSGGIVYTYQHEGNLNGRTESCGMPLEGTVSEVPGPG